MSQSQTRNDKNYFVFIVIVSILVPVAVALLFLLPKSNTEVGFNIYFLPWLNAIINSTVTGLLIAGFIFIKLKKIKAHQTCMGTAFVLSALFLISYLIYHRFGQHTIYGGEGGLKALYLFILLTHIALSVSIVPLVLVTIYFSTSGQFERHKKIARWTLPIWLYVSITGVIVYLMISPYYPA